MSTKYSSTNEVPNEVLCKRLDELSTAITQGKESFSNEFTMRIPAECDRDADLVLSEASKRIKTLTDKTHIVWIKNIGMRPSCSKTLVCLSDGKFDIGDPLLYGWNLDFRPYITQYAIIEE